jgi:hypothetical protein
MTSEKTGSIASAGICRKFRQLIAQETHILCEVTDSNHVVFRTAQWCLLHVSLGDRGDVPVSDVFNGLSGEEWMYRFGCRKWHR